jgi:hypothetical protein
LSRGNIEVLAKGEKEASHLSSSKVGGDKIEECSEIRGVKSSKQKAIQYATKSINKCTSQKKEVQVMAKSLIFNRECKGMYYS